VPIEQFSARNFRCLVEAELEFAADYNLIHGANASGKTSILEALAYLGRGKSFRGATPAELIRHGEKEFVLFGRVRSAGSVHRVGVGNSSAGLELRIDGDSGGGAAALAEVLPLQIIDPDVHELVAGAPERRRRFLDWIAFHVEHGYLDVWRRFRRALKQRNAALRSGASASSIRSWNAEFAELGLELDAGRRHALSAIAEQLQAATVALLGTTLGVEYQGGWPQGLELATALGQGMDKDLQQGSTQHGPHRADLRLKFDARLARKLVSRGQQKLLACAMVLAAAEAVQARLERPLLLLLDDPAAELDRASLGRLMSGVAALGCQVVATSLARDEGLFQASPAVFHVEQGTVRRAP
jgi:DNA replication and repair protein RecF